MNPLKSLPGLLVAAAFVLPVAALAQDHRDDHHDNPPAEEHHDDHRAAPAHDDHGPRGAGPDHNWHKGDRVPAEYRDKRYEVTDWKARHLRQPPRGYHWVNVNGDFVLAAIATGVIADLFLTQ